jgi:glutathione S-transferase
MKRRIAPTRGETMNYRSVAEARDLPGLRLVLSMGAPGPWGEAAKSIFHVKGVPYTPVGQFPGMPNEELVEWTGHANAPIAILDGEKPRTGWSEILALAERIAPEPRLIPRDAAERVLMFGLCHEICGENGFGWTRRLMLLQPMMSPTIGEPFRTIGQTLAARYEYSAEAAAAAPARVADILRLLSTQLARQRDEGHDFLVGSSLSAADIYWATFAALVGPLPDDLCPLPPYLRDSYANVGEVVGSALDPQLLAHRDRIYRNYLQLPMSF